jgi:hypothetical protein
MQLSTILNGRQQEFSKDFIQNMRKTYQGEITKEIVEKTRLELLLHYKTTPREIHH